MQSNPTHEPITMEPFHTPHHLPLVPCHSSLVTRHPSLVPIPYIRFFVLCSLFVFVLTSCGGSPTSEPHSQLSAVQAASGNNTAGFSRVLQPRPFDFPHDHGAHPDYATEWWYFTGNLDTDTGQHFGFQLTFFRSALAASVPKRTSDWATSNIYMAHFALTDVGGKQFYAFERFSRGAAGLAGAVGDPSFRVWLEDWHVSSASSSPFPMRLHADQDGVAIDMVLNSRRPVVLQGDRGLSQKGSQPGNASYYYSYTHMETQGEIQIKDQRYSVRGLSWMDHEFGTGMLDPQAIGWDWFAIQLDDGRDLLYARVRATEGRTGALGSLIDTDGSVHRLDLKDATFDVLDTWRSPHTAATYPSKWHLSLPSAGLDLHLTPYLTDQELPLAVSYWEGAVRVEGVMHGQPVRGNAYVELTGYVETNQGSIQVR